MALSDLPTLYDMSDPASNLALDIPRFTFGEGVIPAGVAAILASERYGVMGGALAAVLGYMAPLPVVGLLLVQQANKAFSNQAAFSGVSRRRYHRRRSRRR